MMASERESRHNIIGHIAFVSTNSDVWFYVEQSLTPEERERYKQHYFEFFKEPDGQRHRNVPLFDKETTAYRPATAKKRKCNALGNSYYCMIRGHFPPGPLFRYVTDACPSQTLVCSHETQDSNPKGSQGYFVLENIHCIGRRFLCLQPQDRTRDYTSLLLECCPVALWQLSGSVVVQHSDVAGDDRQVPVSRDAPPSPNVGR